MHSTLFISDLHLSRNCPVLTNAFIELMQKERINQLTALYIVGDWFDVWIGDDDNSVWLTDIVEALQNLHASGTRIYVMQGNRDFLLGQDFCNRFGGQLVGESITLTTQHGTLLVEHGDRLCTDDTQYQAFRTKSRNPQWQAKILALPLWVRKLLAAYARRRSYQHATYVNRALSLSIMDVNPTAVEQALQQAHATILLHGHTHRPNTHSLSHNRQRLVLGDWRTTSKQAIIARLTDSGLSLECYTF